MGENEEEFKNTNRENSDFTDFTGTSENIFKKNLNQNIQIYESYKEKSFNNSNKINITDNPFNKNKNILLNISATYDPALDSRNETSVEKSDKEGIFRNRLMSTFKENLKGEKGKENRNNVQ